MKRSEAITVLADIILHHFNCDPDCCETDKIMYSNILNDIENKMKMLPPERKEIDSDGEEFYQEVITNTWESEDKQD